MSKITFLVAFFNGTETRCTKAFSALCIPSRRYIIPFRHPGLWYPVSQWLKPFWSCVLTELLYEPERPPLCHCGSGCCVAGVKSPVSGTGRQYPPPRDPLLLHGTLPLHCTVVFTASNPWQAEKNQTHKRERERNRSRSQHARDWLRTWAKGRDGFPAAMSPTTRQPWRPGR